MDPGPGRPLPPNLNQQVETAARTLLDLVSRHGSPNTTTVQAATSRAPEMPAPAPNQCPASREESRESRVQLQLSKQFPAMFNKKKHSKGQSRFSAAVQQASPVRSTSFTIFLLPAPTERTPKGTSEATLALAGLGKRQVSITDDSKHQEIEWALQDEFPQLKQLTGGWMFFKSAGGSGQRKLCNIIPDKDGYTANTMKQASNNGKNTLYVMPLQEKLSTLPLPPDAPEFANSPRAPCMKCGASMPLQMLIPHSLGCGGPESGKESETEDSLELEDTVDTLDTDATGSEGIELNDDQIGICPLCQREFTVKYLRDVHVHYCLDGRSTEEPSISGVGTERPCTPWSSTPSVMPRLPQSDEPRPSTSSSSLATLDSRHCEWKAEPDPQMACQIFKQDLLVRNENEQTLTLRIDLRDDPDEQQGAMINFYKEEGVQWAAPVRFRLLGDVAVGKGVTRNVFSRMMNKLQNGFQLSQGHASLTRLFDGEPGHLVPSASAMLVDSELFTVAGRMIAHSFLHGGPILWGLSPAFVHFLTGGTEESTVAMLTLQDCPDLDHRETIQLLSGEEGLSEDQRTRVLNLCLAWDFEAPTASNRLCLFQNLLMHAVIRRVTRQIQQLRKGLQESGIWQLISSRKDVLHILFPTENILTPQDVLERIKWPSTETDYNDSLPIETVSRITGFLRTFISQASPEHLRDLTKFWIGWEVLPSELKVEVTTAALPTASTCFEKLRLPGHYKSFERFKEDMMMCLKSVDSGFGLV